MSLKSITKLSEQLDALRATLDKLMQVTKAALPSEKREGSQPSEVGLHQVAVSTFDRRRARSKYFGRHDIFGEPAWDILLDLYIRQSKGEQMSIKSASIGSGAPATTALRWIRVLEVEGLIICEGDPGDHRRKLIKLTPEGEEIMNRYFKDIGS